MRKHLYSVIRFVEEWLFVLFPFFFSLSPETFLDEKVRNNGAAFRPSRLLALFVPNSIGTLKRALTKQNRI